MKQYQKLGRMGKRNLKKILDRAMKRSEGTLCTLLFSVLVIGCQADLGEQLQSGRVLAWQGLEGRWVGAVVPTENACGSATQGLMSIGENGFGFDPFQSTSVINGEVADDGHLVGSLSRQGTGHQNLSISFDGRATGSDTIGGTLQSGRCRWTVTLHRG